eukprot:TRINITY_DN76167_c0_g1_i1.p1 TRINITY_DN76167_c0_g1~~TRINITY_DN76167_c0_g1_i1.p1  ORF type:complete len:298 (-),score=35.92 TRINITY_DN76167_c0_g1_i1:33-926(-)
MDIVRFLLLSRLEQATARGTVETRHVSVVPETSDLGNGCIVPVALNVELPGAQRKLHLLQPSPEASDAARGDWTSMRLWQAAASLVDFLLIFPRGSFTHARILELGCGLGLPGMVCGVLGARVLLTDTPETLGLLLENVKINFSSTSRIQAAALSWTREGTRTLARQHGPFSLVLCADCVYAPLYGFRSAQKLAECIVSLCAASRSTVALLAVERRPGDGVPSFLRLVRHPPKSRSSCYATCVHKDLAAGSLIEIYAARLHRRCKQGRSIIHRKHRWQRRLLKRCSKPSCWVSSSLT